MRWDLLTELQEELHNPFSLDNALQFRCSRTRSKKCLGLLKIEMPSPLSSRMSRCFPFRPFPFPCKWGSNSSSISATTIPPPILALASLDLTPWSLPSLPFPPCLRKVPFGSDGRRRLCSQKKEGTPQDGSRERKERKRNGKRRGCRTAPAQIEAREWGGKKSVSFFLPLRLNGTSD